MTPDWDTTVVKIVLDFPEEVRARLSTDKNKQLTENVPKKMSQVKLMVTRASLQADLPSFSDWETGSADMDKLLLQSSSCRDLDDWHDHHCNNGQQSFVEFEDMADKH